MILPTTEREKALTAQGYQRIGGIDEVGRGCWAGPVVTACVIFPTNFINNPPEWAAGIRDSKTLSLKQRLMLDPLIKTAAIWSIEECSAAEIDQVGISRATQIAMERTVADLDPQPDYLLFDGRESLDLPIKQESIIDGDAKIMTIAAASIIAKVYRDQLMAAYDGQFPGYIFSKHVGYGTPAHIAALRTLGTCPIHRMSYKPVKKLNNQP